MSPAPAIPPSRNVWLWRLDLVDGARSVRRDHRPGVILRLARPTRPSRHHWGCHNADEGNSPPDSLGGVNDFNWIDRLIIPYRDAERNPPRRNEAVAALRDLQCIQSHS